MPGIHRLIYGISRDSDKEYFVSIGQLEASQNYGDYLHIHIHDVDDEPLPMIWPKNLQSLTVTWCKIHELPSPLPVTLRTCKLSHNRFTKIPDSLGTCYELEDLNMQDNLIETIAMEQDMNKLPPGLVNLNLSYNRVHHIAYNALPSSLAYLDLSFNFLTRGPDAIDLMHFRTFPSTSIILHHNDIVQRQYNQTRIDIPVNPNADNADTLASYQLQQEMRNGHEATPFRVGLVEAGTHTVYKNVQNVHASSVQSSLNTTLDVLKKLANECPIVEMHNDVWLFELNESLWPKRWYHRLTLTRPSAWNRILASCHDKTVHSEHAMSFRYLLYLVWRIARSHEHRDEMCVVLRQEIEDGWGYCFTGRFSRVANALAGFIEGVHIGISNKEQMQARISTIWNRLQSQADSHNNNADQVLAAIAEVKRDLDESNVTMEDERAAWLEPFKQLLVLGNDDN